MNSIATLSPRPAVMRTQLNFDSVVVAAAAMLFVLWFAATTAGALHWFVLPVSVCVLLIGGDAVRWLRGRYGAFDPAGVIGLLGVYLFFIAPLLHVRWDVWMQYVQPPLDWRNWLGAMAILNCIGLLIYRAARATAGGRLTTSRTMRALDARRFWIMLTLGLFISATIQYWVYEHFNGLLGYIRAYEQSGESFQGLGFVFLISESFPILAMIGFAVLAARHQKLSSWWVLFLVLLGFFALKMVFGGLRGSRSNTVWGLFWAVGIIHLWIRPLPRRALLLGIPLLTAFMFGYGLYKAAGLDGLATLRDPPRAIALAQSSGRTFRSTLLSDLGRSDVQAYTLYRVQSTSAHDLAWGQTYAGGLALLIPRSLYPTRPATKVKAGTDITYGRGTYDSGRVSTRVYGLAGEALLNFGLAGVPFAFLIWGLLVGFVRRAYYGLAAIDARRLLLPLWVNLMVILLIGDSDNWVFFFVKEGSVPLLLIMLSSRRIRFAGDDAVLAEATG